MTPELTALTLAALLQVAQFSLYSLLANLQIGPKTALGPRDEKIELTGKAGRAQRAMNNHFEGLILFYCFQESSYISCMIHIRYGSWI